MKEKFETKKQEMKEKKSAKKPMKARIAKPSKVVSKKK